MLLAKKGKSEDWIRKEHPEYFIGNIGENQSTQNLYPEKLLLENKKLKIKLKNLKEENLELQGDIDDFIDLIKKFADEAYEEIQFKRKAERYHYFADENGISSNLIEKYFNE